MSESKPCSRCKQIKLLTEFYARKASKDGLQAHCINCEKLRQQNISPEQRAKNVARAVAWAKNNPEQRKINRDKSNDQLRSIRNERNRNKYQANPESFRAKKRSLRDKNKPLYDRHGINRRAIKRASMGVILSLEQIESIRNSPCTYCGKPGYHELDHVIPLSRGGTHTIENIVSACRFCNASKGNKLLNEWQR